jgi:AcrR family transcriptional regulator
MAPTSQGRRPARPRSDAARAAPRSLDRATVVATAADLVDEAGLDALNLAAVAARLGVTQPALYRHVDSADDLTRRLALLARQRLLDALRDAAAGRAADDALTAVASAWRTFVQRHPGLYAATDRTPLADDPENEAAVERIVSLITQLLRGFTLSEADARQAAWSVRSALHGFVSLEAGSGNPSSLELDRAFEQLLSLLIAGLHEWTRLTRPS